MPEERRGGSSPSVARFVIKQDGNSNSRGLEVHPLWTAVFPLIEPMTDQSSTFRRAAKTAGRILLLAILSVAIGAFVAAFLLGFFRELGTKFVSSPGEFAGAVLLVAAVTFAGLLWWRRGGD